MQNSDKQIATVTRKNLVPGSAKDTAHTDKIVRNRRENLFCASYTGFVVVDGEIKEICDLRIYHKSGTSTWSACFWIHDRKNEIHQNGSGRDSGGYGYDHESDVAASAILDAGVTLSVPIDGRGQWPLKEAIEAILEYLYPGSVKYVHNAHG